MKNIVLNSLFLLTIVQSCDQLIVKAQSLTTVVSETLAVFRMPHIRKNGQYLDGQCFADHCIYLDSYLNE